MTFKHKDYCINCRKETEYSLKKDSFKKQINNKEYEFFVTVAICSECGEEMSLPGLLDLNAAEFDEQYREYEGIVSVKDIKCLMDNYNIGKAPLSLALGFGEITITRYLLGQIPSKEYSNIIKNVLHSPALMKEKLNENKDKIASAAYRKSIEAILNLEELLSVSEKMMGVISYIFSQMDEVSPLTLQKLLYFIQGVSCAVNGKPMFNEKCEAWVHGPVYPKVYRMFQDFKYNPIEDSRFVIFKEYENKLSNNEKKVISLVIDTFGIYNGKILEKITHKEEPWIKAREGYDDNIPSKELISVDNIKSYYMMLNNKYDFSTEEGLRNYIDNVLKC